MSVSVSVCSVHSRIPILGGNKGEVLVLKV